MTERTLPGIGLTGFWDQGAPWKVGGDQNWLASSVLTQLAVESATTALPASPLNGVIYIVPAAGSPANQIAARDNGAWKYFAPQKGWTAYVRDTGVALTFDGAAWAAPLAGATGASNIGAVQSGAGATPWNVQEKNRKTLLVEDFTPRASFPAGSDIGPSLQLALNEAASSKRKLRLTAELFGNYPLLTPVAIAGDIEIDAERGTIINAAAATSPDLITLGGTLGASVNLGADVTAGSNVLNVPAGLGLAPGDTIRLTTNKVQVNPAANLTLSATTADAIVTVTADASVFSASDVGRAIVHSASGACLTILTYASGTSVTAWTNDSVAVPSTSFTQGGWYINELFNPTRYYYFKGEMARVRSVAGTAVTLDRYLADSYSATFTAVKKINAASVAIGGFTIVRNMDAARALVVNYGRNTVIDGVFARGARNALITADSCLGLTVTGCGGEDFWYSGSGTSYGLSVSSSQDVLEVNNRFEGGRSGISHGGLEPNRNISVLGNFLRRYPGTGTAALQFHGNSDGVELLGNFAEGLNVGGRNFASRGNRYVMNDGADAVLVYQETDSDYFRFDDEVRASTPTNNSVAVRHNFVCPNLKLKTLSIGGDVRNAGAGAALRVQPRFAGAVGGVIDQFSSSALCYSNASNGMIVQAQGAAKVQINDTRISGLVQSTGAGAMSVDYAAGSGDIEIRGRVVTEATSQYAFNSPSGTGVRNITLNGATLEGTGTTPDRNYFGNTGTLIITGSTRFNGFTSVDVATQAAGPTDVVINDSARGAGLAIRVANGSAARLLTLIEQGGQRTTRANAAPAVGTWSVGDRCVNSTPVVGNPKAWACTVAGTPGTWVSEGNL